MTDEGAMFVSALWLFALGHPWAGSIALALVVGAGWRRS